MGKINMGRVILGGLVAGIVIDVFEGVLNGAVLADQWTAYMSSLGKPAAFAVNQLVWFNLIGLLYGILTVRLYAAIRPRFGPGPRTALRAGIAIWLIGYLLPNMTYVVAGLAPQNLTIIALAVEIVEVLLAALAGAALYKEDEAVARQAVPIHS
jgi:hypothetical protein